MRKIDHGIEPEQLCAEVAEYDKVGAYEREAHSTSQLFVVGSPRSGTTVMGRCLGAHPKAITDEESFFLLHLWHVFSDLYKGGNWREWSPLGNYIEEDQLIEAMGSFSDKIINSLLDKKEGANVYVDHTPWYASIAPFIDKLYPEARYVHMVRDGRSVVSSLNVSGLNGFSWAGTTVKTSTELWAQMVERAQRIGMTSPDRYIEVRYEDFVRRPKENLERVSNFAGLDFANDMLPPLRVPHSTPSRDLGEVLPQKERGESAKWPSHWGAEEREDFTEIARGTMERLGYFKV